MSVHLFGIRHHGPGSARSLRRALEALQPDVVLLEGPPEANEVLWAAASPAMVPPVALLVYDPAEPKQGSYYPFAVFSPEWQTIQFTLAQGVSLRFMDLPQTHWLALSEEDRHRQPWREDPLKTLAEAAGYSESERWWEDMVEQRRDTAELFAAIHEAMSALRADVGEPGSLIDEYREAWMRQTIRTAEKEGFSKVAVVCGAWHTPALADRPPAKQDAALLKGLPKRKVQATWVPWSNSRLLFASGYGAGIESPGWYRHLWQHPEQVTVRWVARVAQLLREEDLDASSAQVIEAVRLADTLATLRGRPAPGLPELNEAIETVMLFGNRAPLQLIQERLIVGDVLGTVPAETPVVPLQRDLEMWQKRLRLSPQATQKNLTLDLRSETDRARSELLHRLLFLEVPWGEPQRVTGKTGTFHEGWLLQWKPEFALSVIVAASWGNTVEEAATRQAQARAADSATLTDLTRLLQIVIRAALPLAVPDLVQRLQSAASVAADVGQLMASLPPLVQLLRYSDVRQTDASLVEPLVRELAARIAIGLPQGCSSLDDGAAQAMFTQIQEVDSALKLLQHLGALQEWHEALHLVADQSGRHGLVQGRCWRLLLDVRRVGTGDIASELSRALSPGQGLPYTAAWLDGLLRGSGLLLLHDGQLWQLLDEWVLQLKPDVFLEMLPLLRRTFATFPVGERREMSDRVRRSTGPPSAARSASEESFDPERAALALPLLRRLLGLEARP